MSLVSLYDDFLEYIKDSNYSSYSNYYTTSVTKTFGGYIASIYGTSTDDMVTQFIESDGSNTFNLSNLTSTLKEYMSSFSSPTQRQEIFIKFLGYSPYYGNKMFSCAIDYSNPFLYRENLGLKFYHALKYFRSKKMAFLVFNMKPERTKSLMPYLEPLSKKEYEVRELPNFIDRTGLYQHQIDYQTSYVGLFEKEFMACFIGIREEKNSVVITNFIWSELSFMPKNISSLVKFLKGKYNKRVVYDCPLGLYEGKESMFFDSGFILEKVVPLDYKFLLRTTSLTSPITRHYATSREFYDMIGYRKGKDISIGGLLSSGLLEMRSYLGYRRMVSECN